MEWSGKNNPCPICGRDKDDKCRWDDEIILCYCGDDFAPPPMFRVGQIVKAFGLNWALVNKAAGFASASYCFIRNKPLQNVSLFSEREKEVFVKKKIACSTGLDLAFRDLRKIYHFSLSARCLECMTLQELKSYKVASMKVSARARALRRFIAKNRTSLGKRAREVIALRIWEKQAMYDLKEFERFERYYLGEILQNKTPTDFRSEGVLSV